MIWYIEGILKQRVWYSDTTWLVGYAPTEAEAVDTARDYAHRFKLAIRSVAHLYKPARKLLARWEEYRPTRNEREEDVLFKRYLAFADVYMERRDQMFKQTLRDPHVLKHADRSLHRIMEVSYVVKSLPRLGAEGAHDVDPNVAMEAAGAAVSATTTT